jgi:hypothetical protein
MTHPATAPTLPRWARLLFWAVIWALVYCGLEWGAIAYLKATRGYDGHHLYEYVFDPYKEILPAPNFVDTRGIHHNSQGFRHATDVQRHKPPGTYRIFLMGASAAYGLGGLWTNIEPRYPVIPDSQTIDAYLTKDLQPLLPNGHVEVINAAITSSWTHQHLIYLNQTILNYEPDMILFLDGFADFYFYNKDHDEFADYAYDLQSHTIMGPPTMRSLFDAGAWWLFRKNALAHVAGRAARRIKEMLAPPPNRTPINVEQSIAGLQEVFPRGALAIDRRMGLILTDAGVRPVFMLQPLLILERGHKPLTPMEQRLFAFNDTSYLPNYQEFMRQATPYVRAQEEAMAKHVGGTFIDLTQAFTGVTEQVYTDYCHLTPFGNALVARTIADRITPLIQADVAAGHVRQ